MIQYKTSTASDGNPKAPIGIQGKLADGFGDLGTNTRDKILPDSSLKKF